MADCYKITYETTADARIAAESMRRRKGEGPIRIYLCKDCNKFHTTSMKKGVYKNDA